MSEFIKKRVVKDLIDELADIDASSLELIGHKVIETRESKMLVHHGINKDHKPVGYTIDSFTQDFSVVGEYSTQARYFEDSSGNKKELRFDKIEGDIEHAMSQSGPNPPSRIYLVSREEEPPSFRASFNRSELGKMHGKRVHFLDARELARTIFQASQDNPAASDFYRYYLPDFAQNLDKYEYYGRIPSACVSHQSERLWVDAIQEHFARGAAICVLYGLSGSGKTQAAIEFAHVALPEFGNYLWISGEDWKDGVPLTAVKRSRGGVAINVAGVFNTTKTLLIVDDLPRAATAELFTELAPGFALGGRVLVTSQLGEPNSPIHVPLPLLSHATARRILGEEEGAMSDACRRVIDACRFCPLILAVTREVAKLDGVGKEDLYREVLEDPAALHQGDGQQVMARILNRLSPPNREALLRMANSGCTTYDSHFLTAFVGANARAALQRLAILNRTAATSTLSVHDLICRAVRTGAPDGRALAAAVEQYIERHGGDMVPSVLRQIHLSSEQLEAAHDSRGGRRPDWLAFGLLQIDGAAKKALIAQLHDTVVRADMPIAELRCVVDAKEAHSYSLDDEARKAHYASSAAEYAGVAAATGDPAIRAEMLHHQGKALRRCGQVAAALECFQRLMREQPEWHATNGQLAHLGTQVDAEPGAKAEGERAIRALVNDVLQDLYAVPLRVSLAAISRLRSYQALAAELKTDPEKVRQLADVVALSALEGFDQFYEGFLALTSLFGYQHDEICLTVAEVFPDMLAIFPNAVDKRQWTNTCEALTNASGVALAKGRDDLARKLSATASAFAFELGRASGDKPYQARVITKTFLAAGMAEEALESANRIADESKDHWLLYQQAKAEAALADHRAALKTAERALESAANDPRAQDRLSIYYDQVSQCFEALNMLPEATANARAALDLVRDSKYKGHLTARITRLEQQSQP